MGEISKDIQKEQDYGRKNFCNRRHSRRAESVFQREISLQKELDKEDYMIICGDFGLVWEAKLKVQADTVTAINEESEREKWWMDWLEALPFTVLFVDGNHENFDRLNQYAVEEWNGGKVHKIRPSVIHLMRGQVFTLAGKRIFTFGGARSHDISDGILEYMDPQLKEKKRNLNRRGALYRVNHESWWKEEMPSLEEMEEGLVNLSKYDYEVDYIISHCCPGDLHELIHPDMKEENELTLYFDTLKKGCRYKKWYFGHYHDNKNVTERDVLLYKDILELGASVDPNRPESTVTALTKEEIAEHSDLLSMLAVKLGK